MTAIVEVEEDGDELRGEARTKVSVCRRVEPHDGRLVASEGSQVGLEDAPELLPGSCEQSEVEEGGERRARGGRTRSTCTASLLAAPCPASPGRVVRAIRSNE